MADVPPLDPASPATGAGAGAGSGLPGPWSADAPTQMIPRITDGPAGAAQAAQSAQSGGSPEPVESLEPAEPSDPAEGPDGAPAPGQDPDSYVDLPYQASRTRSSRTGERIAQRRRRTASLVSGFGEVLITLGVVVGLYVVYTLWWTNVTADAAAHTEANKIQQQFTQQLGQQKANPTAAPPATFNAGVGFGLMTLPAINIRNIPIMQGVDKATVLDKGAVGHYTDPKSAMPWDPTGNFAVAAHRRTHGEPFRYINKMQVGDHVVVETSHGWYVYVLDKELPQTSPDNIGTIAPIPVGGPYTKPGQYITLTTCTPEWASTYRLIWWGHLEKTYPLNGPAPAELNGP